MRWLEWCQASCDEQRATLPGDEFIAAASTQITHAITIAAPCERVWPWLVQLGSGRARWYAYDRIDNGGVPSARRIRPELQHAAVGDVFPALPGARDAFVVIALTPPRTLVLGVPGPAAGVVHQNAGHPRAQDYRVTWTFVLHAVGPDRTRLLVRGRIGDLSVLRLDGRAMLAPVKLSFLASLLPLRLIGFLARPGHWLMESKMLRGIKQRAEAATAERRAGTAVATPAAAAPRAAPTTLAGPRGAGILRRLGASHAGVWLVKHVVAPLDRALYGWTGGRGLSMGRPLGPRLLLTTTGRRTGRPRTTPVFYLRDGDRLIICNVNPGFERPNPWVLNLRARPVARVRVGRRTAAYRARVATDDEVARYWPRLVALWPAYQKHFERSGERTLFILEQPERYPPHDTLGHFQAAMAPGISPGEVV